MRLPRELIQADTGAAILTVGACGLFGTGHWIGGIVCVIALLLAKT